MALIARFQYPGLPATVVQQASYSVKHGLTPDTIMVDVPAGTAIPQAQGTAVFTYGAVVIPIVNCKFDIGTSRMDGEQVWTFAIKDGRWPFEFGEISGHYNIKKPDGSIQPGTAKTPQQLAQLLMQAMNVSSFDISAMDNTRRPEVNWSGSNPAAALASLADEVGCRPVWWIDGSIQILPLGFGADLPNLPATTLDFTFKTASIPQAIKVYGAPTLFQARWLLEAVGLDTDGIWKPLDGLSYTPANGWGKEAPGFLSSLRTSQNPATQMPTAAQQIYDVALRTVYHCYRMKQLITSDKLQWVDVNQNPFDMTKLNYSDTDYFKHCLPLTGGLIQLEAVTDVEGGERKPMPPIIRGDFFDNVFLTGNVTQRRYKGGFGIDAQNGIVNFSLPTYLGMSNTIRGARSSQYSPANLTLEIAFHIMDENWAPVRPYWIFPLSGDTSVGMKILETNETRFTVQTLYDQKNNIVGTKDNRKEDNLDQDAQELANVYLQSLGTVTGGDRTYPGLYSIQLDGALCQVSWHVGKGIPTTRVGRNTEHDCDIYPSYAEKRRRQREEEEKEYGRKNALSINLFRWAVAEQGRSV